MKKTLIFPLCLILCGAMLILSACADNPSNGHSVSGENEQTTSEGPDGPGAPEGNSGILIVYFSATGNTAELANYIHDRIGGDLVEIQPEIPYTAQDLNYSTPNMRPQVEHDTNARPAVSQETYDAIDIE